VFPTYVDPQSMVQLTRAKRIGRLETLKISRLMQSE
jgi:hypothetical protein